MGKKKKNKGLGINDERVPKLFGVLCLFIAAYLFIAFTSYLFTWQADQDKVLEWNWRLLSARDLEIENWLGRLGAVVSNLFFYWGFGLPSFLLIPLLIYLGLALIRGYALTLFWERLRNGFLVMVGTSILLEFILRTAAFPVGGAFGDMISTWLIEFVGTAGLIVLLIALAVVVIVLNVNPDFKEMTVNSALKDSQDYMKERWYTALSGKPKIVLSNPLKQKKTTPTKPKVNDLDDEAEEIPEVPPILIPPIAPIIPEKKQLAFDLAETTERPSPKINQPADAELEIETVSIESILEEPTPSTPAASPLSSQLDKVQTGADLEPYDPTLDLPSFEQPVLALLNEYSDQKFEVDRVELEAKKDQIIETLLNYKIEIQSVKAVVGPTVTLFKVKPAPGVRISKIKSLEDDIALSLSALGIRIIAPIPGEGVIGIEVPNEKKQIVSLKEVLASETFKRSKMQLPIAFGKTISNQVFVADLAKMPHLLIAGATGQGKSVGINVVLMSLLYQKHPSQVKLVLIDPKKVELSPYAKLENHFLSFLPGSPEPITTETNKVIHTLNSLCIEMDERYNLLKKAAVRNIKEYNEKFIQRRLSPVKGHRYLPFIVLVIDEFADLIMTAGKEVELPIGRLAQLARAIGIHLIIATQRPSVNIITGIIKANFPARIAFKVTSKVDSRTILDSGGADQLIGQGDMLLSVGGDMIRLQCAFVDTPEVENVINFIADQRGYPEPYFLPEFHGDDEEQQGSIDLSDLDDMLEDAAKLIVQNQHGSTSMIQRRLKLGYNRAGRIMDQLEALGVVGPSEGSKPREVLMYNEVELEKYLTDIRSKKK